MMEPMIPPQVEMRLWTKRKKRKKKEAIKKEEKKGPNKKMREKEGRDDVTILLPHLCFKVAP